MSDEDLRQYYEDIRSIETNQEDRCAKAIKEILDENKDISNQDLVKRILELGIPLGLPAWRRGEADVLNHIIRLRSLVNITK